MSNDPDDTDAEGSRALVRVAPQRSWLDRLAPLDMASGWKGAWHRLGQLWARYDDLCVFVVALVLAGVFGAAAMVPDSPTTPGGMLALELPGTRSSALSMLERLRAAEAAGVGIGTHAVSQALWADCGFIAAYACLLSLALKWVAARRFSPGNDDNGKPPPPSERMVDRFAAWSPWVAGGFDYLENAGLWLLIHATKVDGSGLPVGALASLTTIAALCKWTVLTFIAIYFTRLLVVLWWRWVLDQRTKAA